MMDIYADYEMWTEFTSEQPQSSFFLKYVACKQNQLTSTQLSAWAIIKR